MIKKYKIKEIETNKILIWSLKEILTEINCDHSDEWQDYTKEDWEEGWNQWCEGQTYTLMGKQ